MSWRQLMRITRWPAVVRAAVSGAIALERPASGVDVVAGDVGPAGLTRRAERGAATRPPRAARG